MTSIRGIKPEIERTASLLYEAYKILDVIESTTPIQQLYIERAYEDTLSALVALSAIVNYYQIQDHEYHPPV